MTVEILDDLASQLRAGGGHLSCRILEAVISSIDQKLHAKGLRQWSHGTSTL
jgi:hypothetical protein